ncbi:DNA methyltransferase [Pseudomonas sp. FSL R10-2398]|uniref:DNA methyltransferase n=1 Tax=Pseudomonas sp. FSL R10-2398 TaxID=2662201 RepID=UPI00129627E2|nr:DNA methyltransferase [Pseudomonas sp. FSL R10-2398]MQT53781.1 site-specific DNA-methyltransferase [Pseudomonas sp. FSL R10-2398]
MTEDTNVKKPRTSTVGRAKALERSSAPSQSIYTDESVSLSNGNSLNHYDHWDTPTVIISDGAYGILGFEGDTSDHLGIPEWYEPHIEAWSKHATAQTTLWFWNSEIGWAAAHPILQKHGWRYVNANTWNKGKAHVAGNVNTAKIRRFPVVSEVCVQYVFEARIDNETLQHWLHKEWKRTGLTLRSANEACGVKDAATRKYLDQGHLWYFPPAEVFAKMAAYANENGRPEGRPYLSQDGIRPMTADDWSKMRSKFNCPHGWMNVWDRPPLKGSERIKVPDKGAKVAHLNQKPLDLMKLIIEASSDPGDVIWEPFGGLFSASLAAKQTQRKAFSAELDSDYFQLALTRFQTEPDLFT